MNQLIQDSPDEYYRQARETFDQMDAIPIWNDSNQVISSTFNILQQLADDYYGKAFYPLSKLYCSRQDVVESGDQSNCLAQLAFEWCFFNQSIQDVEIWCDLGSMYDEGYGAEQNDEQAMHWFRKAAEQGAPEGQCGLGVMYAEGRGVPQDKNEAAKWLGLASEQGHAKAQRNLGLLHANG